MPSKKGQLPCGAILSLMFSVVCMDLLMFGPLAHFLDGTTIASAQMTDDGIFDFYFRGITSASEEPTEEEILSTGYPSHDTSEHAGKERKSIANYVVGGVVLFSVVLFFTVGFDKWAATEGEWRVPEAKLLGYAVLGGWPGGILGGLVFRHKTGPAKLLFRIQFALAVCCHLALCVWIYYWMIILDSE